MTLQYPTQIKYTDARVKLCAEIITGIKAIKLYAWEAPYVERIMELRDNELKHIKRTQVGGGPRGGGGGTFAREGVG